MRRYFPLIVLAIAAALQTAHAQASATVEEQRFQAIDKPDPAIVRQVLARWPDVTEDDLKVDFADCEIEARAAQHCATYWGIEQDVRLNRVYAKATAAMSEERLKSLLVRSERTWIAYRDAQCLIEANREQRHSWAGAFNLQCIADMTRQRANWLQGITPG